MYGYVLDNVKELIKMRYVDRVICNDNKEEYDYNLIIVSSDTEEGTLFLNGYDGIGCLLKFKFNMEYLHI